MSRWLLSSFWSFIVYSFIVRKCWFIKAHRGHVAHTHKEMRLKKCRGWGSGQKQDWLHVLIHVTHMKSRFQPWQKLKTHNSILFHGSCRATTAQASQLKRHCGSTSVTSYLISPVTPSVGHREGIFFSLWRWRGGGSEAGAASPISVSPCWHDADRREAAPDYRTDVFHLALSVDTSCLLCMRGQH